MFQTFSGNSRRARQVNLSGRGPGSGSLATPSIAGTQNAITHAQQERLLRQRERDRLYAARKIQRVWRGHQTRRWLRAGWRRQWDSLMDQDSSNLPTPHGREVDHRRDAVKSLPSQDGARLLARLRLLLRFLDVSLRDDLNRLEAFTTELLEIAAVQELPLTDEEWQRSLLSLAKLSLDVLGLESSLSGQTQTSLLFLLFLARALPEDFPQISRKYYKVLSKLTQREGTLDRHGHAALGLLISAVLAPLQAPSSKTLVAYESFAWEYLTTADLPARLRSLEPLTLGINHETLVTALAESIEQTDKTKKLQSSKKEGNMWLLAYVIYFRRSVCQDEATATILFAPDYLDAVSTLLTALAGSYGVGLDIENLSARSGSAESVESPDDIGTADHRASVALPSFVRQQVLSLLDQRNISGLLANNRIMVSNARHYHGDSEAQKDRGPMTLASYILTLLRIFPHRADDIRMWLYLGSWSAAPIESPDSGEKVHALIYFWQVARQTEVFELISHEPRNTVELIKPAQPPSSGGRLGGPQDAYRKRMRDRDWMVILVFLELYSFVLKIMDDDEFFAGSRSLPPQRPEQTSSWTRANALSLEDIKDLTVFLKNLGFAMYWYASDLAGVSHAETGDEIRKYFTRALAPTSTQLNGVGPKIEETQVAGISGMTVKHVRRTVIALLRMLYERDSRRAFLPRDHWLMPSKLDMEAFIPAVVVEEEKRHSVQGEGGENDAEDNEANGDDADGVPDSIIGATHAQQTRRIQARRLQQLKVSREKYLELVTPRLEILQNMPYLIPFATRVRIFREFVSVDQIRRRGGYIDPDHWRGSLLASNEGRDVIAKHHAKISRENLFEDAYDQFYELADGLKEPIQITFVDQFGAVEAGIDGGGVTKEFLTSVTQEAFSGLHGLDLFVENDKHLLYPNPASVDERKDVIQHAGIKEGSAEWNGHIRGLLRRYEFLGRIIGKCLYEGILVNVGFAGFFLLKWASAGGIGSASGETGYTANLNDLRDLDESLYQGLLQLKYYPGNVEDFSLNFTITDTISTSQGSHDDEPRESIRTITRELKPNGSNIPVTTNNRLFYISYVARHRLQVQPRLQTNAFLHGLSQIIQPSWLSMFNQAELQTLISGDSSEIDVSDLRSHTQYGGVYAIGDDRQEHPSVQLFWNVMRSFSDSDRRKVLQFVTSTPRAPLLGFGQLHPWFSIRDAGADQERLPSTSTCVNLLKLPRYSNEAILRQKLLYAINSGAGFDLS